MYTRCPYCHTYFKVLAEHLKKAGGQVRCGQCYKVFNSIGNLIEKLPVPLTEKRKKEPEFSVQPQSDPALGPSHKPAPEPQHTPVASNFKQISAPKIPAPIADSRHLPTNKVDKIEFKGKASSESFILSKKDKIFGIHAGPHSPNKNLIVHPTLGVNDEDGRSEERRVGKECRSRWSAYH